MTRKVNTNEHCKPLEEITYDRIMSMILIESTNKIRLLHDTLHDKGFTPSYMYIILDGRTNQTYQTPELATARWFFNQMVRSTICSGENNTDFTKQNSLVIY